MGYTHFWTYNPNEILNTEELREKFRKEVAIIDKAHKIIKKKKYCVIHGGLGQGTPMINESQVWFNGDEKKGLDHETFDIKWFPSGGSAKDFCKTARKPYDLLVCVSLLAFKHAFDNPDVFSFSSDGDNEDWEDAKDLYMDITFSFVGEIFPEKKVDTKKNIMYV
jgi:hypothetical protein